MVTCIHSDNSLIRTRHISCRAVKLDASTGFYSFYYALRIGLRTNFFSGGGGWDFFVRKRFRQRPNKLHA